MNKLLRGIGLIFRALISPFATFIVESVYHGYFPMLKSCRSGLWGGVKRRILEEYNSQHCCSMGNFTIFESAPTLPHGVNGIFISIGARIGSGAVIFQQVTIGSNTLKGHPRFGSPTIGRNVYIGAGAKIIGRVSIGDNCRIGANAVVATDMPANTTAVAATTRFIPHDAPRDNSFDYLPTE